MPHSVDPYPWMQATGIGVTHAQLAIDTYVHGHDIARSTDREFSVDEDPRWLLDATVETRARVYDKKRAKGLHLEATD